MTLPNPDKYERAQSKIAAGDWTVDAEAGEVYTRSGRRIGSRTSAGYTFLTMTPAAGSRSNQNVYAHRVIWESVHGPIPESLRINHINGLKHDARIANLELVTESQNIQHAVDMGLLTHTHGEDSVLARVTAAQVRDMRERAAKGETQQSIALSVGLSRQHVGRIIRRERWAQAA